MKKLIAFLLILCCVATFAACGKNEEDDGKALETAETFVQITGDAGSLSLNKSSVISLLEIYDKKSLGLSKDIYEYDLKLSATRFMEKDACLVEAFSEGAEKAEGTFIIADRQCFVYDAESAEYLLLTVGGAVIYTGDLSSATTEKVFEYNEKNNKGLHDRFSKYTKKQLGLEKELSEYVLIAAGTTTTAENGETVYVIRLYEKDGTPTNVTIALNENGDYAFSTEVNKFVKIS